MRVVPVLVALLQLPGTSAAQSGADRALLSAWEDSLARVTSAAALARFETPAYRATGAARDIHSVLLQLRKAALTSSRGQVELGLIRLASTGAGHHDWPWPDYLMARTFFALGEHDAPVLASSGLLDGESHIDAAWRHLRSALSIDPTFGPARRLAATTLLAEGDRELRDNERAALSELVRFAPEPDALLAAARDLRSRRMPDSALRLLDRAILAGGDRSTLQLERARTLRALADSAGAAAAYWDGALHLSARGREFVRYDLAWIVAPDTLKLFDAVSDDSVAEWLGRFWGQRDAAAANLPGERLQEHLRRVNYAFAHYRVASPWRRAMFRRVEYGFDGMDLCVKSDAQLYALLAREQPAHPDDPRHHEPLLDHRGLIYLHHGSPVRVVYGPGSVFESDTLDATNFANGVELPRSTITSSEDAGLEMAHIPEDGYWPVGPNESWLYWIDGDWRVLNFRGSAALGRYGATTLTSYLPVRAGDWLARADLTPEYRDAAMQIYGYQGSQPLTCLDKVRTAINASRADADVATRTDSDTPLVLHPWNAVIQAYALGSGTDRSGEGLLTVAIPVSALHVTGEVDGQPVFGVAARIVGYDRRSGRRFALDTVRHFAAPASAAARAHLSSWFEFRLQPGDWQVAIRLGQRDSLGAYALAAHLVVDAGTALSLSDVVIGSANGLAWPAPDGATFPLNVLGAWTPGSTAEVYYEVRGLAAHQDYHVMIEVRGIEARQEDVVRVESTDRASGPVTRVRKSLGLAQLKPGVYRVIISVDAGGAHATRERRIVVVRSQ